MTPLSSNAMGCFLIGATGNGVTKTGDALLGSVSDNPYDIRTFVRGVKPEGFQPHLGTELISVSGQTLLERGYMASAGETTRGVNQAGLAFTCAAIFESDSNVNQSEVQPFADLTEGLMNRCDRVRDAIELLESAQETSPAVAVLLADAEGDLAHVEIGSFGVSVYQQFSRRRPGVICAVNCYLSQKLVARNAAAAAMEDERNNNLARWSRGQQLAEDARGTLDVPMIARILSDHSNDDRDPLANPLLPGWGYSICNHGTRRAEQDDSEEPPWGTVSAEILEPANRTLWYAYGWPCGRTPDYGDQFYQDRSWGEFVPFKLRDVLITDRPDLVELTTPAGELTAVAKVQHDTPDVP